MDALAMCKFEEYCGKYLKSEGGKDDFGETEKFSFVGPKGYELPLGMLTTSADILARKQKVLESYRSFKTLKDEQTQENLKMATSFMRSGLTPSLSFNDKMVAIHQVKNIDPERQLTQAAVIKLSYKRKPCEMQEGNNTVCKSHALHLHFFNNDLSSR